MRAFGARVKAWENGRMEGVFAFAHAGRTGAFPQSRAVPMPENPMTDFMTCHTGGRRRQGAGRGAGQTEGAGPSGGPWRGPMQTWAVTAKAAKSRQGAEGAGSASGVGAPGLCVGLDAHPPRAPAGTTTARARARAGCEPAGAGGRRTSGWWRLTGGLSASSACQGGADAAPGAGRAAAGSDARAAAPGSGHRKGAGQQCMRAPGQSRPGGPVPPVRPDERRRGSPSHTGESGEGAGPQARCRTALSRPSRSCGAKKRAPGRARNQVRWRLA